LLFFSSFKESGDGGFGAQEFPFQKFPSGHPPGGGLGPASGGGGFGAQEFPFQKFPSGHPPGGGLGPASGGGGFGAQEFPFQEVPCGHPAAGGSSAVAVALLKPTRITERMATKEAKSRKRFIRASRGEEFCQKDTPAPIYKEKPPRGFPSRAFLRISPVVAYSIGPITMLVAGWPRISRRSRIEWIPAVRPTPASLSR